jgi:hypothetical protein
MRTATIAVLGLAALCGAAVLAEAQDQKPPIDTSLLISNVLRQPVDLQQRQLAFDESLRHEGPAPRKSALVGEVQPDGSVKYGNVTVSTLKNPCPPGEHVELPAPVPLRRASR